MTREELKKHCEKQIEMCEMWAKCKGEEPHGKIYEEHKLILELLEQETVSKESYDHEYFLRKELEIKIARLERQESALNKIKAEIEQRQQLFDVSIYYIDAAREQELSWVLEVIDKYKGEGETDG